MRLDRRALDRCPRSRGPAPSSRCPARPRAARGRRRTSAAHRRARPPRACRGRRSRRCGATRAPALPPVRMPVSASSPSSRIDPREVKRRGGRGPPRLDPLQGRLSRPSLTLSVPAMPSSAWRGTSQTYGYLPAFLKVTLKLWVLPVPDHLGRLDALDVEVVQRRRPCSRLEDVRDAVLEPGRLRQRMEVGHRDRDRLDRWPAARTRWTIAGEEAAARRPPVPQVERCASSWNETLLRLCMCVTIERFGR